jgi:hypothetical protein
MSSKPLLLFRPLYSALIATAALYEIFNDRDQERVIVIEGPVHELHMFLHKLLQGFRGGQGIRTFCAVDHVPHWGHLLCRQRGVMRLRTPFSLSNAPKTPYGQTAEAIMLVNFY